jgi:hypothetical protein
MVAVSVVPLVFWFSISTVKLFPEMPARISAVLLLAEYGGTPPLIGVDSLLPTASPVVKLSVGDTVKTLAGIATVAELTMLEVWARRVTELFGGTLVYVIVWVPLEVSVMVSFSSIPFVLSVV